MLKRILTGLVSSVVLAVAPAFGHAKLTSSLPADHAQLAAAPATLILNFSESARLAALKVKGSVREVPVTVDRHAKASATIVVSLPTLEPDSYEVQWTALAADDGHITKGSFSFTVAGSKSS